MWFSKVSSNSLTRYKYCLCWGSSSWCYRKRVKSYIFIFSYLIIDIFRPFQGFKQLRLIPRDTRDGERVHFCFADFENAFQTTMVIHTLQGYRFHKDDIIGLSFSYATSNNRLNNHSHNSHNNHNSHHGNKHSNSKWYK